MRVNRCGTWPYEFPSNIKICRSSGQSITKRQAIAAVEAARVSHREERRQVIQDVVLS